jgi:hypothetical protein
MAGKAKNLAKERVISQAMANPTILKNKLKIIKNLQAMFL